jgi:hypothetical protein
MASLIEIQEEYMAAYAAATRRWEHRRDGGHAHRSIGAAARRAVAKLTTLGFTATQCSAAIRDAADMARLEMASDDDGEGVS